MTAQKPGETEAQYLARLAEDTWLLQRDQGETDDDYALRCLALGCAADGTIRLRRWRLAGGDE